MSTSAAIALKMRLSNEMATDMPRRLKSLAKQVTETLEAFAQARSLKRDWR